MLERRPILDMSKYFLPFKNFWITLPLPKFNIFDNEKSQEVRDTLLLLHLLFFLK